MMKLFAVVAFVAFASVLAVDVDYPYKCVGGADCKFKLLFLCSAYYLALKF